MKRFLVFVLLISLLSLACNASVSTPGSQATDTPAPFPDTPSPPEINAPIVEAPSLVRVEFSNSLDGWGVTEMQIVRTNDGGITWYNVTPLNVSETGYSVSLDVLNVNHVWMQAPDFENYPHSGFLHRTTDGGVTWTMINVPFSGAHIYFIDENNGWALADLGVGAGSNAVAVYQTTDGGSNWTRKYINDPNNPSAGNSLPLGGLKFGIVPINMQTAWVYGVIYSPGTVYLFRTDDGGATWKTVSLPLPADSANFELGIDAGQMDFVDPMHGYIVVRFTGNTYQSAVYTTSDGGNTWLLTPTLIPDAGSAVFTSATDMVLYNGDQFYVTNDAAQTWRIVPPDVNFGDTFASMDFSDLSTGWVLTMDPTNHRTLYRSGDGGATWFPVVP